MSPTSFGVLPALARVYVGAVTFLGAATIAASAARADNGHSILFAILLCLSLVASIAKVNIPVPGSDSSLTVCHVIDYAALIVCGPSAAVLVAAWGGWTQCTFKSTGKNPVHQVAFSVASLGLAMWSAGWVYTWLDGQPGFERFAAAATVFFVLNSGFVAAAVALSTRQPIGIVWFNSFLASWPSYSIGACLASALATVLERRTYWLIPLLGGPLVLLHRNFGNYVNRLNEAMTDPLTKLPNQRFLMDHLTRALSRARASESSLAIIFLDLNNFKALNDRGGHATGDAALRLVASRLKSAVRSRDTCARYGGDEFVVVLADCGRADAMRRAEELQSAVGAPTADSDSGLRLSLSVSAGVAVFPEDGDTIERLLSAADRRMYERKFSRSGPRLAAG